MSRHSTILVIEDDPSIRRGMVDAISYAGHDVLEAANGADGLNCALEALVDLVLLDVMLPEMDGFTVLRELRAARPTLPVIMVTARGAEDDRVRGLRDGADDYVTKPFSALELLARVDAVLRRSPERPSDVALLHGPSVEVDLQRREARGTQGEPEALTEREAQIIRYLYICRDRAVDRDELLHRVWGLNPRGIETRTVDMQIARLREKLTRVAGTSTTWIQTVRGKGYMLGEEIEARTP